MVKFKFKWINHTLPHCYHPAAPAAAASADDNTQTVPPGVRPTWTLSPDLDSLLSCHPLSPPRQPGRTLLLNKRYQLGRWNQPKGKCWLRFWSTVAVPWSENSCSISNVQEVIVSSKIQPQHRTAQLKTISYQQHQHVPWISCQHQHHLLPNNQLQLDHTEHSAGHYCRHSLGTTHAGQWAANSVVLTGHVPLCCWLAVVFGRLATCS
jgi:hypothetical protein